MESKKEVAHEVSVQEQPKNTINDKRISEMALKITFNEKELKRRMSHIHLLYQQIQDEVNSLVEIIQVNED